MLLTKTLYITSMINKYILYKLYSEDYKHGFLKKKYQKKIYKVN